MTEVYLYDFISFVFFTFVSLVILLKSHVFSVRCGLFTETHAPYETKMISHPLKKMMLNLPTCTIIIDQLSIFPLLNNYLT